MGTLTSAAGLPALSLQTDRAASSQEEMNLAVADAKSALMSFRAESRLEALHLFIKAPSALSLIKITDPDGFGLRFDHVA